MDWPITVSCALIVLGAALMLVNIVSHRRTMVMSRESGEKQTQLTKALISVHMVLMAFFFLGYLAVLYLFVNKVQFISSLFVAVIFFFGAIFVFLGIVIQKRMFVALNTHNIELQAFNDRLKQEQRDLLELNEQLKDEIVTKVKEKEAEQ